MNDLPKRSVYDYVPIFSKALHPQTVKLGSPNSLNLGSSLNSSNPTLETKQELTQR